MNEIVKCAVEDIRLEYQRKGVRLETEIQAKQIRCTRIRPVSRRLLKPLQNALKFTKGQQRFGHVTAESDDAVIVIRDEGIGIAPEISTPVFAIHPGLRLRGSEPRRAWAGVYRQGIVDLQKAL